MAAVTVAESERVRLAYRVAEALEALEAAWPEGVAYPLGVELPDLAELAFQVRRLSSALAVAAYGSDDGAGVAR